MRHSHFRGKGSKLRISNLDSIWSYQIYVSNYVSLWRDPKLIQILIYLLTAIGLTSGGSSTVHMYTQAIHRTIQNKRYIEQHNNYPLVKRHGGPPDC